MKKAKSFDQMTAKEKSAAVSAVRRTRLKDGHEAAKKKWRELGLPEPE